MGQKMLVIDFHGCSGSERVVSPVGEEVFHWLTLLYFDYTN